MAGLVPAIHVLHEVMVIRGARTPSAKDALGAYAGYNENIRMQP